MRWWTATLSHQARTQHHSLCRHTAIPAVHYDVTSYYLIFGWWLSEAGNNKKQPSKVIIRRIELIAKIKKSELAS
jgi:hypothetical protein